MTNAHDLERMAAYHAGDEPDSIRRLRENDNALGIEILFRRLAKLEALITELTRRLDEQDAGK